MFQVEVVAAIGMGLAYIIWLVRLEAKVNKANDEIVDLKIEKERIKAAHDADLRELSVRHEKALDTISQNHKSEYRVVWEKIDSLQSMVHDVLKSSGRLEGKLEVLIKQQSV